MSRAVRAGVWLWLTACCLLGCSDLGLNGDSANATLGADALAAPTTGPISFWKDIAPMFMNKCTLCHHPDNPTGVDLTRPFDSEVGIIGRETSWPRATERLIVDPGKPSNSFLLTKVSGHDLDTATQGVPMPLFFANLNAAQIRDVRDWIQNGADDNDRFANNVAPIFGDGMSIESAGRCSFCHYEGSNLPDLTHPFSRGGVVNVKNSRGQLLVAPGDPDASLLVQKIEGRLNAGLSMPLWLEPLSAHEVDLVERWIRQGAREN